MDNKVELMNSADMEQAQQEAIEPISEEEIEHTVDFLSDITEQWRGGELYETDGGHIVLHAYVGIPDNPEEANSLLQYMIALLESETADIDRDYDLGYMYASHPDDGSYWMKVIIENEQPDAPNTKEIMHQHIASFRAALPSMVQQIEKDLRYNKMVDSLPEKIIDTETAELERTKDQHLFDAKRLYEAILDGTLDARMLQNTEGRAEALIHINSERFGLSPDRITDTVIPTLNALLLEASQTSSTDCPGWISGQITPENERDDELIYQGVDVLEQPEDCTMTLTFPNAESADDVLDYLEEHYEAFLTLYRQKLLGDRAASVMSH